MSEHPVALNVNDDDATRYLLTRSLERAGFTVIEATTGDEALVAAVIACAEALLRVGGVDGRALVERAAQDPLTQNDVRRALPAVLTRAANTGSAQAATR